MLSKLALIVSGGRNVLGSISMPSRSLIAMTYSARLSLWKVRLPGFGLRAACSSMLVSSAIARACLVAASGCCASFGGIMPTRNFRIIFSAISAFS